MTRTSKQKCNERPTMRWTEVKQEKEEEEKEKEDDDDKRRVSPIRGKTRRQCWKMTRRERAEEREKKRKRMSWQVLTKR